MGESFLIHTFLAFLPSSTGSANIDTNFILRFTKPVARCSLWLLKKRRIDSYLNVEFCLAEPSIAFQLAGSGVFDAFL